MNRRAFLCGLTLGALALPLAGEAQQAGEAPRIGFLYYGSPGPSQDLDAFRQVLGELGYIEGQNIVIEYRFAGGQVGRLPELAADIVRLKVDVIVTPTTPASLAARHATSTIPIVFAGVADPVGAGLIASFARPGGNVTGLASISAELGGKRLELLKQVVPKASRVAVLYNPSDQSNVLMLKQMQESAPALRILILRVPSTGPFVVSTLRRPHAREAI